MQSIISSLSILCLLITNNNKAETICDHATCFTKEVSDDIISCFDKSVCQSAVLTATSTIKCGGQKSCFNAECNAPGGTVICNGDKSCMDAEVSAGTVVVSDREAGYRATVIATDSIHCSSQFSCFRASLLDADKIFITADRANPNVISAGSYVGCLNSYACWTTNIVAKKRSRSLEVELTGLSSGYQSRIECPPKGDCMVDCAVYSSCWKMQIEYDSTKVDLKVKPRECGVAGNPEEERIVDVTRNGETQRWKCPVIVDIAFQMEDLTELFGDAAMAQETLDMVDSAETAEEDLKEEVIVTDHELYQILEGNDGAAIIGQTGLTLSWIGLTVFVVLVIGFAGYLCCIARKQQSKCDTLEYE